jgi:4-hydroxy-2-oxoheptanedioate aldolase
LCIVMVETALGLANVAEIAALDGVDAILLGPGDLALSLGLGLSNPPHDAILDACAQIVAACATSRKISAAAAFDRVTAQLFLDRGVQMLAIGADMQFMLAGARETLGWIEGWKAGTPPA